MSTATLERPGVAMEEKRKRGRPATSERDDVSVKIDRQVIADLRRVAEFRGIYLAQYLTDLLRPIAEKEYAKYLKDRHIKD